MEVFVIVDQEGHIFGVTSDIEKANTIKYESQEKLEFSGSKLTVRIEPTILI